MLFSSTVFIYLFLTCVLFGYYVLFRKSRKAQNIFLLLASIFFYAWGEPKFVIIMMASVFANWLFGLLVDRFKNQGNKSATRLILVLTCVFNLGLLFVFKYLTFTSNVICDAFGIQNTIPSIALPIGISFFTFQAMSYVLDVYREKGSVQKNILNVGLYISFFPQLIAGPIVRYQTVAEEINNRRETLEDFCNGFARFVVGLSKKVLLSNSFAMLADGAFDSCAAGDALSVASAWLGAIAYTLQIFFDFSGYSDMAIGLGKMFGFHFLENFNYPYISTSVSEFWRRWHMSLGQWFRDYVYFPLGGSRVKKPRLILNLFIVWSLTGLWHGANWTFLVWGLLYFVLLTFEKLTGLDKKQRLKVLKWLYTMFFVIFGWVIFRVDSLGVALTYMKSMFGANGNAVIDGMFTGNLMQNALILLIGIVFCTPVVPYLKKKIKPNKCFDLLYVAGMVILFMLCISSLIYNSYNPFIYFNF